MYGLTVTHGNLTDLRNFLDVNTITTTPSLKQNNENVFENYIEKNNIKFD